MAIIPVALSLIDKDVDIVLSNNNLTATKIFSNNNSAVRATHGKTTGKWYWEVKFDSGGDFSFVGVSNKNLTLPPSGLTNTNWRMFSCGEAKKYPENVSYGSAWAVGNIIGIALDLESGKLEFYKNGVSMGISHTNLTTLGEVYPTLYSNSAVKACTFNFGATPFTYSIPSGFTAYTFEVSNKILLSSSSGINSIVPPVYATETAIPAMTSNTAPSGRAFASSEFGSGYQGWKAFDKIDNPEGFATVNGSGGIGYLGYEFTNSILIGKYALRNGAINTNFLPKDWTFEGSNDGTGWTILDTQTNQTWTTAYTEKEYIVDINNMSSYKMYRLNWTAKNGSANYTNLNELKLFEVNPSKWIAMSEGTEQNFLKYGMDNAMKISQFKTTINVKTNSVTQSSGKTFEHTVDMSKRRIDRITLN